MSDALTRLKNNCLPGDAAVRLRALSNQLMRGESLPRSEAAELLDSILSGETTDAQIATALVALAIKGETADELAGMADAMRTRALPIDCTQPQFIDTAGTGSSRVKTFNISTATAFVVAGAGLAVAKHGARAATSRSGSADVLSALGVNITPEPSVTQRCLNEIGVCFMFAPLYHSATARVAAIRREIGVPTSFNLLGPLTNPARPPFQIVGVCRSSLVKPLAQALATLGTSKAWVVHGSDGLDELTLAGPSFVTETHKGALREFELKPEDFGLARSSLEKLPACDAEESARVILEILERRRSDGSRHVVVMNAAAALLVGGKADNLSDAAHLAERSLDSGAALGKLNDLVRMTNG